MKLTQLCSATGISITREEFLFLSKGGFSGPVYTHPATRDLALVLLQDSARLNERDIRYENRLRKRKNMPLIEPLYTVDDVVRTVNLMQGLKYGVKKRDFPGSYSTVSGCRSYSWLCAGRTLAF